uniref:Uncharacterized protein n=1 Tax=Anguilla anguilla TaxID=7936 RepID=A0A0E9T668_ANGAN
MCLIGLSKDCKRNASCLWQSIQYFARSTFIALYIITSAANQSVVLICV